MLTVAYDRTPQALRDSCSSPHPELPFAQRRLLDDLHRCNVGVTRALGAPCEHGLDVAPRPLEGRLHAAVGAIADPARQPQGPRALNTRHSVEDPLDAAGHDHANPCDRRRFIHRPKCAGRGGGREGPV